MDDMPFWARASEAAGEERPPSTDGKLERAYPVTVSIARLDTFGSSVSDPSRYHAFIWACHFSLKQPSRRWHGSDH
nr:hypothetical protein CFP56_00336 [Quercus suber]